MKKILIIAASIFVIQGRLYNVLAQNKYDGMDANKSVVHSSEFNDDSHIAAEAKTTTRELTGYKKYDVADIVIKENKDAFLVKNSELLIDVPNFDFSDEFVVNIEGDVKVKVQIINVKLQMR